MEIIHLVAIFFVKLQNVCIIAKDLKHKTDAYIVGKI